MEISRRKQTLFFAVTWIFVFAVVLYFGLRNHSQPSVQNTPAQTPKEQYSKQRVSVLPRRAAAPSSVQEPPSSSPSPDLKPNEEVSSGAEAGFTALVSGRLVGPGREPISYQKLCISWKNDSGLHERQVITNRDGDFSLDRLQAGLYWWSSSLRGGETSCEGEHPYDNRQSFLIEDKDVALGEIVWALPAYASIIRGEVFELNGQPAVNCEVLLRDVQNTMITRTDDHGRFAFNRLFPDEYDLLARSSSGLAPPQKITPLPGSTKTLNLVLTNPSGAIEGRVFGADRAPFGGLTIVLRQPGKGDAPSGPYDELITKSRDDGRFRFDRLPSGHYKVEFQIRNQIVHQGEFQIVPGKTVLFDSVHLPESQD